MCETNEVIKKVVGVINEAVRSDNVQESLGSTINREIGYAYKIFNERVDFVEELNESLMCSMHQTFSTDSKHNCLGCNFDDLMWQISDFLKQSSEQDFETAKIHHFYSMYFLLLNGVWERMEEIFSLLGVVKNNAYESRFHPFITVRRWANFFKHPRSFIYLVHHPAYTIKDSDDHSNHEYKSRMDYLVPHESMLEIDTEFVRKHCTADTANNNPIKKYRDNKTSTVVVFPHVDRLTDEVCGSLEKFVELITANPYFVETLSDESTVISQLYGENQ